MRYLKKYQQFGKVNEANDTNATKISATLVYNEEKTKAANDKNVMYMNVDFTYDSKKLQFISGSTPSTSNLYKFVKQGDIWVLTFTNGAFNFQMEDKSTLKAGSAKIAFNANVWKDSIKNKSAIAIKFGGEPGKSEFAIVELNISGGNSGIALDIAQGFEMDSPELTQQAKDEIVKALTPHKGKITGLSFKTGASQDGDVNQKIKNVNTIKHFGDKEVTRQEWDLKLVELRYATLKAYIESLGFKGFPVGHPANDKNVYGRFDKANLKNPINRKLIISNKALE